MKIYPIIHKHLPILALAVPSLYQIVKYKFSDDLMKLDDPKPIRLPNVGSGKNGRVVTCSHEDAIRLAASNIHRKYLEAMIKK